MHFADDFVHTYRVMRTIRIQIELCMPRLAEKLEELELFDRIVQSFYVLVLQNFGFTGQECGISMETALRLFEFFVFNCDSQSTAICTLIIYCLQICEEHILNNLVDNDEALFRFIGHGQFIELCLGDKRPDLFNKLVNDYLVPD